MMNVLEGPMITNRCVLHLIEIVEPTRVQVAVTLTGIPFPGLSARTVQVHAGN